MTLPRRFTESHLLFFGLLPVALCTPLLAEQPAVDTRPLVVSMAPAFPEIQWPGWSPLMEDGTVEALRPILLTHAGDGSGRIFVPTQRGVIYVLRQVEGNWRASIFLNIRDQVAYSDGSNEEGFLGLAFHPRFRENGRFFVYYTNRAASHQNVVSGWRIDPSDPEVADPASEQVLITMDKPYWNHDGGTLCFGLDGYLYFAVGDGGAGHDPHGNGQSLKTMLGKIHRIDVDKSDGTRPYGVPVDNPFVGVDGACAEIWAYGLRNVWRMAFDGPTGELWAADVGQDVWEEIDLIVRGGNYGWNLREGRHPHRENGSGPREDLIEPIWEYHHDVGKSIIGGFVYRGTEIPELCGAYLYADYVSGRMWALFLDPQRKSVVANRPLELPGPIPVVSFGEDECREAYFMTDSPDGKGIYRLRPAPRN